MWTLTHGRLQLTQAQFGKSDWLRGEYSGPLQLSPVVVDGVMYVTEANSVTALDVHSGRSLWSWTRPIPNDLKTIGFSRTNRGVSVIDELVVVGTLDAHLVALDAKTGAYEVKTGKRVWRFLDHSRSRRTRTRIVEPRSMEQGQLENRWRLHLGFRNLRSRVEAAFLGRRQSWTGLEW